MAGTSERARAQVGYPTRAFKTLQSAPGAAELVRSIRHLTRIAARDVQASGRRLGDERGGRPAAGRDRRVVRAVVRVAADRRRMPVVVGQEALQVRRPSAGQTGRRAARACAPGAGRSRARWRRRWPGRRGGRRRSGWCGRGSRRPGLQQGEALRRQLDVGDPSGAVAQDVVAAGADRARVEQVEDIVDGPLLEHQALDGVVRQAQSSRPDRRPASWRSGRRRRRSGRGSRSCRRRSTSARPACPAGSRRST